MTKAIETGLPKMRIEEAAARRQARIDSGKEVIVGVNKYLYHDEAPIAVREVDNRAVRESQIQPAQCKPRASATRTKSNRPWRLCAAAAETGEGNLLDLSVQAARVRATLGEISYALEQVFGRYQAVNRTISGVYSSESQNDPEFQKARQTGR